MTKKDEGKMGYSRMRRIHALLENERVDRVPDVKNAGLIPFAMDFAKLQNKYSMFIQPHIVDPFSFAGHICGVDSFMKLG